MPSKSEKKLDLRIEPVTKERWRDLEKLFGERGACGGCWCMSWRLTRKEFDHAKGAKNKRAFKKIVISGEVPGILGYDGDEPIGWCSVAPRERFITLQKSRSLKPIDDQPVWSVSCLFIDKRYRRQGVAIELLKGAAEFVRLHGGRIIEGYPSITKNKLPDPWVWTGVLPAFLAAGFTEVARPSNSRAIVRREV